MCKGHFLLIFLSIILIIGCTNKKSPEYIVKKYLEAVKKRDWKEAEKYTDEHGASFHRIFASVGTDFGLTDIHDIQCLIFPFGEGICSFRGGKDTACSKLNIVKSPEQGWLVHSFDCVEGF